MTRAVMPPPSSSWRHVIVKVLTTRRMNSRVVYDV